MVGIAAKVPMFSELFRRLYPELELLRLDDSEMIKDITFVVTEDCNLRCTYCYEHNKNSKKRMTKDIAKKAVDMIFNEQSKPRGKFINSYNTIGVVLEFVGGEPFLEIELIDYIVEYFRYKAVSLNHRWALNYMISFSTNGVLYNDPRVQDFLRRNDGRVSLSISIDGNKELHDSCRKFPDGTGSYDVVEKAFKHYLGCSSQKSTKVTISPENIEHLFSACKHLFEMGLTFIPANCVFENVWELKHAQILYEQLLLLAGYLLEENRYSYLLCTFFDETIGQPLPETENQNWCGGTGKMLAIAPDGKLYPCLRYLPFSLNSGCRPLVIGDVDNGIEVTEEQREVVRMLNSITRRSQSTDECFYCPVASGCAWCSAYNYEATGTPGKRATYICIMHKARVLANYYYWNRVYKKAGIPKEFKLNLSEEDIRAIAGDGTAMLEKEGGAL